MSFTRKEIVLGLGSLLGAKCVPNIPFEGNRQETWASWTNLSPPIRIQRLELKQYPKVEGFKPLTELIRVSAQFYHQETKTAFTPEDLQSRVVLTDPEGLVRAYETGHGKPLSDKVKAEIQSYQEIVTPKDRKVYLNTVALDNTAEKAPQEQPDLVKELGKKDYYTVNLKSVLMHAFSHVEQSNEYIDTPLVLIPGTDYVLTALDGFVLSLKHRIDGTPGFLNGGNEAMTEYHGHIIAQRSGVALANMRYGQGALLLDKLNKAAGLNFDQYRKYYIAELQGIDLFKQWGSIKDPVNPDLLQALYSFIVIALRVNNPGSISQDAALKQIQQSLLIKAH